MSDKSSDEDLDEERYDPGDNLNAYGSPIYQQPDTININENVKHCERTDVAGIVYPGRTQVSAVHNKYLYCSGTFLTTSVNNLTLCPYSSAVVKTHAVKVVGGKRRVVLVATKDCNVQNFVHVGRRKFHAKTRRTMLHRHIMIQAQVLTLLSDMHLLLKRQREK